MEEYVTRSPQPLEDSIKGILDGTRQTAWVDYQDVNRMIHWFALISPVSKLQNRIGPPVVHYLSKMIIEGRECSVCSRKVTADELVIIRMAVYDEVYVQLANLRDDYDTMEEAIFELIRRAPFASYPTWVYSLVHHNFCNDIRELRNVL